MMFAAIVALPLVTVPLLPAAVDFSVFGPGGRAKLTLAQKDAAMRPLVTSATDCISGKIAADPRLQTASAGSAFNELIVETVPACADALRAMIQTFDELYGEGSGESYFMGPYLDGLPEAVTRRVKSTK